MQLGNEIKSSIKIQKTDITKLTTEIYYSCSCPYAQSGKSCKHMVAVIVAGKSLLSEEPAERVAEEKRTEAIELHMGDQ